MIPIPACSAVLPWLRAGVLIAVFSAVFSAGAWVNGARWEIKYNALEASFTTFKTSVATLGERARTAAVERQLKDLKIKEKADASNARMHANSRAVIEQLRRERDSASGGGLSAPAPSTADPGRTCFDPAGLAGALRSLDEGLLGIIEEGTKAVIDLDTAKAWAKEIRK